MDKQSKTKPVKKLTRKEKILVEGVLKGKTQTQAAIEAGYSERSAASIASETLKKPNVRELIDSKANKALQVMTELMENDQTPASVRFTASKDILDRAGYKPKEQVELDLSNPLLNLVKKIQNGNRETIVGEEAEAGKSIQDNS